MKTHSLFLPVDRLEQGWAGQLEHGCWQAWTWLSWPAWTWLLTGLFMHVGTDCSVHCLMNEDLNNVVGTIMINQQPYSYILEHVIIKWWNNKIEHRCYNELGCCIKSGFACCNIREQPLSIRQAVYNMLKHDWTILLFYQSCSIMLTVLLQACWANNHVTACDISLSNHGTTYSIDLLHDSQTSRSGHERIQQTGLSIYRHLYYV